MACYHPLRAFRDTVDGKVYFGPPHVEGAHSLWLPCGGCDGCRREKARQWAMRCLHEASLHDANCFVTLTYDSEHLPYDGSVEKGAFQRFMKRLRKFYGGRISYYMVGEYGSVTFRPHYHALLFGMDFYDKYRCGTRGGRPVWRSAVLEKLWPDGISELGAVSFESVSYVARYMVKKGRKPVDVDGETGEVLPERAAEFALMSRRPALGAGWVAKWMCDVYPRDGIVVNGRRMKPPRYYDGKFELLAPEVMARVKLERRERLIMGECLTRRLRVREECDNAKAALFNQRKGV